jgi:ribosomal protein L37AE/L43A
VEEILDLIPCPKCFGSAHSRDEIAAMLREDGYWHCERCGFSIEGPYWVTKPYPAQTFADLLGEPIAAQVRFALALADDLEVVVGKDPVDGTDAIYCKGAGMWSGNVDLVALAHAAGIERRNCYND